MSRLTTLIRATKPTPPKLIIYGQPGVGKTTLAAEAKALLIDCENGAGTIPHLARTPYLETWPEMDGWLQELAAGALPTDCKALAIDTIDWMVTRITEYVCVDLDGKKPGDITNTVGSAHGGFFKAREVIQNVISRRLFPTLNAINSRGVPIILLAHAEHAKITDAEGVMTRMAAPDIEPCYLSLFREWSDAVLYASQDGDTRMLTTAQTATVVAKNRYGLPLHMNLSWTDLVAAIRGGKSTAAAAAESK